MDTHTHDTGPHTRVVELGKAELGRDLGRDMGLFQYPPKVGSIFFADFGS